MAPKKDNRQDWAAKHSLDLNGLKVLCAALLLQHGIERRWAQKLANNEKYGDFMRYLGPAPQTHFLRPQQKLANNTAKIRQLGLHLGLTLSHFKLARDVTIADFQFDWWHLYEHWDLAVFLKPRLPGWVEPFNLELTYDSSTKVIDIGYGMTISSALLEIFLEDAEYLLRNGERRFRTGRSKEEILFALLVSDLVNPPDTRPRGRPEGTGKAKTDLEILAAAKALNMGNKSGALKQILSRFEFSLDENKVVRGSKFAWGADFDAAFRRLRNQMSIHDKSVN